MSARDLDTSPALGEARGPLTSTHEAALPLIELLKSRGVGADEIRAATGFDLESLANPHMRVRLSVLDWLWKRAAAVLDNPAIGLDLIEMYPENHMHFVAHLAMRAGTVGEAILMWRDYAHLVCDADEIGFTIDRTRAELSYRLLDPRFEARHLADHYLALAIHYGRLFSGRQLVARRANFCHADPGYATRYREVFGCEVYFEQSSNSLVFDPAISGMPQVTANPYFACLLAEQARAMNATQDGPDTTYKVTRRIASALAKGRTATLGTVATELALSERSLSRALKAEGTSFRELTDRIARQLAHRYLDEGLSVTQTTFLLGFSEPAALRRSLARWTARQESQKTKGRE